MYFIILFWVKICWNSCKKFPLKILAEKWRENNVIPPQLLISKVLAYNVLGWNLLELFNEFELSLKFCAFWYLNWIIWPLQHHFGICKPSTPQMAKKRKNAFYNLFLDLNLVSISAHKILNFTQKRSKPLYPTLHTMGFRGFYSCQSVIYSWIGKYM